jgi:hypothetical protein
MKPYLLAFQLWVATIFLSAAFWVVAGLFQADIRLVAFGFSIFFGAALISWPLLIPMAALIRFAARIPYSPAVRVCWLAFSFTVLIFVCLLLVILTFGGYFSEVLKFTAISGSALLLIFYFIFGRLKDYYS